MASITAARVFVYSVVAVALIYFFTDNSVNDANVMEVGLGPHGSTGMPDFGRYVTRKILSPQDFPIDEPGRRVIIVGDIHGMFKPLQKLLKKLSYDPKQDVLVHVGDILTKVPHKRSMQTLEFMALNNITGVRGNHDQSIIEWRGWMDWIRTLPGGTRWLNKLVAKASAVDFDEEAIDGLLEAEKNKNKKDKEEDNQLSFRKLVPKGWKLFDHHFRVAYDMTESEYRYLLDLPLVLHIPSAHTFIVHAGLLSHNPRYSYSNSRQPLTRVPKLRKNKHLGFVNTTELKRQMQELSILEEVPQNTVPWNILNMRTVTNDKVSKGKGGTPWTTIWKNDMSRCNGFDTTQRSVEMVEVEDDGETMGASLPCYPSTVVYGHIASRGLHPQRWSIGLDSGCVYGRRLSALVLGADVVQRDVSVDEDDDEDEELEDEDLQIEKRKTKSKVKFGDNGRGRIVSVSCR